MPLPSPSSLPLSLSCTPPLSLSLTASLELPPPLSCTPLSYCFFVVQWIFAELCENLHVAAFFFHSSDSHTHTHTDTLSYIWCVYSRYRYWHLYLYISNMCIKYLSCQFRWPSSTVSFILLALLCLLFYLWGSTSWSFSPPPLSASFFFLQMCEYPGKKSHVRIDITITKRLYQSMIFSWFTLVSYTPLIALFCIGYLIILVFYKHYSMLFILLTSPPSSSLCTLPQLSCNLYSPLANENVGNFRV